MAFLSTPGSTNEVDTASIQLALLSMRARRYFQKTGKKITINRSDTVGYDKTKVECFNCHKMGYFAMECRSPRNQENNSKTGLGFTSYNVVAPTPTGLFAPPTIDLSSSGLEEFKQPEFKSYEPKGSKSVCVDTSNVIKKVSDTLIIGDWVFDCDEDESEEVMVLKPVLKTVEKKTGQREVRPVWNHAMRVNYQNFSNSRRNFSPTAVLTKSGILQISTARQSSLRVAALISTTMPINTDAPKPIVNVAKSRQNAFQKTHSLSMRPFHKQTALKNRYLVNTAKVKSVNTVYTAKGKSVTSVVGKQGFNVVKSSACWVWRPKIEVQDHVSKNSRLYICKRFDYVDSEGRLKSETSPFSQTIKIMMEDLLLLQAVLKELPDENQVLLKVPRKNNMYSFDLKNVVPSKGLTCLFAKATNDESNLWHRRLGHINFKTMNKLVKGNLVRGLPSKIF
nr:ribonuclease H-like domain-containing protein [Tanacetum cinerariifolium]